MFFGMFLLQTLCINNLFFYQEFSLWGSVWLLPRSANAVGHQPEAGRFLRSSMQYHVIHNMPRKLLLTRVYIWRHCVVLSRHTADNGE